MKDNENKKRLSEISIGEFFKFTIGKIIIDFIVSLILVFLFFIIIPSASVLFFEESLIKQTIDVAVNTIIYMILFYPYACLISAYFWRKKK